MHHKFNKNYHLFMIQRKASIFILISLSLAIIGNLIENFSVNEKLTNILVMVPFLIIFTAFYFINNSKIRIAQAITIIAIGITSTLLEKYIKGAGNAFIIWGTLLVYSYGIIKNQKKWHALILFVVLLILNILSATKHTPIPITQHTSIPIIRHTIFSSLYIFALFAALFTHKAELDKFNKKAREYETYCHIGKKAVTLLKDMDCRPIADAVEDLLPMNISSEYHQVDRNLQRLSELILLRDEFRKEMLEALEMNKKEKAMDLDICYGIRAFFNFQYELSMIDEKVEMMLTPRDGIYIKTVPSEIYSLLCNIFNPMIRILMKEETRNRLSIVCTPSEKEIVISIFSSGPGIKKLPPKKDPIIDKSLEWSRSREYYEFVDARETAYAIGGDIQFKNREEGGLEILLKLPISFIPCLSEEEYREQYLQW